VIDDVSTDLSSQHIEGFAIHGDTPFSMPLVSHIAGNLWMGGVRHGIELPHDFRYVVSLHPWERYELGPDTHMVELELFDSSAPLGAGLEIYRIAGWALGALQDGKTLVHCQAGLNRSGLVAGLTLILGGMRPQEAVALLRERRSDAVLCNRTFERWLLERDAVALS